MSLTKTIQKAIEKNIDKFVTEIEAKFGVSKTELIEIWANVSKMNIKNKEKKLSPWLQYCKDQRVIIKKNYPEMSFGEISKMIGVQWKQLTPEQKKTYKTDEVKVETKPITEESVVLLDETIIEENNDETIVDDNDETIIEDDMYPTTEKMKEYDEDDLKKMKTSQLKDICKTLLLSKTGKKDELIGRLLNYKNSTTTSPIQSDDDE